MRIYPVISNQNFLGLSNPSDIEKVKSSAVVDYDEALAFIKAKPNNPESPSITKIQPKTGCNVNYGAVSYPGFHRVPKILKGVSSLKNLTLGTLRRINSEYPISHVVRFHTTGATSDNALPFIYIYRNRGNTFSINSYMQEVMDALKDYPNAIAKILISKDPKTGIVPSVYLSKDIWRKLFQNILVNADKKYLTIIKDELQKLC